jgi:septal ring-binding cell division protein DamX
MKKVPLYLFLVAFTMIGFSCGESEAERMAREQARIDSIRVAEQAALEARMQAVEDSLAAVEAARLAEEAAKTAYTFDENGSYVIQTGSWRSEVKANQIADRWSRRVPAAYVVQGGDETSGDVWFRVRIGYFPSIQDAQNFGAEMGLDYWVTTRD